MADEIAVSSHGVELAGEQSASEGPVICLLHGLTATREVVVHGSKHLPRWGYRLISYDARGHGLSEAAPAGSYGYDNLADDAAAVLAAADGEGRPVLAGHSMGAHTIAALALRDPGALAGIVLISPAVVGEPPGEESLAAWDRLADGLERDGVEGFIEAYDHGLAPEWRETLFRIARQRLKRHEHPEAVAQALREVPRSIPFDGMGALDALDAPALVVASHDEADPGHPYAVAAAWREALPEARLISEEPGESPLAWQGGKLSRAIEEFCASDAVMERR